MKPLHTKFITSLTLLSEIIALSLHKLYKPFQNNSSFQFIIPDIIAHVEMQTFPRADSRGDFNDINLLHGVI